MCEYIVHKCRCPPTMLLLLLLQRALRGSVCVYIGIYGSGDVVIRGRKEGERGTCYEVGSVDE